MKKMLLTGGAALFLLLTGCTSNSRWSRSLNAFLGRDQLGHERTASARRKNATNDALTAADQKQIVDPVVRQPRGRRSSGGPLDWVQPIEHEEAFSGGGLTEQERAIVNRLDRGTAALSGTEAREIDAIRERNKEASKAAAKSIW